MTSIESRLLAAGRCLTPKHRCENCRWAYELKTLNGQRSKTACRVNPLMPATVGPRHPAVEPTNTCSKWGEQNDFEFCEPEPDHSGNGSASGSARRERASRKNGHPAGSPSMTR